MDPDTFLTTLYVMIDDFCKASLPSETSPGPRSSLSRSEVMCLSIVGQWCCFGSERRFWRWAQRHLRGAFPGLPHSSQFNRLARRHREALVAFSQFLATNLEAQASLYEILDTSGVATRDSRRRGCGWLPEQADIGKCTRLGWFEGFRLLLAVSPQGVITGFGFAPASTNDRALAETLLALRQHPHPRLASVGSPAQGVYLADKGFEGAEATARWREQCDAEVIVPPRRTAHAAWSPEWCRWFASLRQIVESVYEKLHVAFGLSRERPHHLTGFQTRLAAKVALHNFCLWLNVTTGRDKLAFSELMPF